MTFTDTFIQAKMNAECKEEDEGICGQDEFQILLDQKGLDDKLLRFKQACTAYEMSQHKRYRHRYHHLGLMAKLDPDINEDEMRLLLKNGLRSFLVDVVTHKKVQISYMLSVLNTVQRQYQTEDNNIQIVTGLAVQITGDNCRVGRLRNDCSVFMQCGDVTTLTTDYSYRYSGFREIVYVINLKYYINSLKLGDLIGIGKEVCGRVVKKLKSNIAVLINSAGIVNSFEFIQLPNQCYSLPYEKFTQMFKNDLKYVKKTKANFIVVPCIRCLPFLKALRHHIKQDKSIKLIGSVDITYACDKMADTLSILSLLDILWIPDLFTSPTQLNNYISQDILPLAMNLKKLIIGTVPLQCCSDFRAFENHEYLWKIDCMFIEKSKWCHKYPLIVKKLLPIKDYRMGIIQNMVRLKYPNYSYKSVVAFIIRTITTIECHGIIMYTKCEKAAAALSRPEIYCPVYVLLPLYDEYETDPEIIEKQKEDRFNLVRYLNLHRNLRSILYTKEANTCELSPIEFGIALARRMECIKTGDFIITLEVGKENEDEGFQLGEGDDVVIMRAYYLPPMKEGEVFQCK